MEDYPRSLAELETRFGTEQACRDYLMKLRWPEGFVCPRCNTQSAWGTSRNLQVCTKCQYQGSVTAGTIFQDTRKPLTLWFRAIWWVTTQKNGASALGVQRILGLGSYTTAWIWLHKLRRAMVRPGRDRLSGRVEVDETYIGAVEEGTRGRQKETKALVAIACEEDGRGIGRIRLRHIPDASAASLHAFVEEAIEPGSVVHTDGWESYAGLEEKGYKHKVTILKRRRQSPSELLPRVHLVASLLSAGCLEPIKALSVGTTWPTISTSLLFASTDAGHVLGASCSIVCFNRLLLSHRNPTKASLEVRGTSENHNILGQLESNKYPNFLISMKFRGSSLVRGLLRLSFFLDDFQSAASTGLG